MSVFRPVLLLVLFAALVPAQTPSLKVRVFDIDSFVRAVPDAPADPWDLPLRSLYLRLEDEDGPLDEDDGDGQSRADFLVRMIRDSLGHGIWDEPGSFMRLNEGASRLIVRHRENVLKKVERFLEVCSQQRRQPLLVQTIVVDASKVVLPSLAASGYILSSSRMDALLGGKSRGLGVLARASSRGVDGQRIRLRHLRFQKILARQGIEVAQGISTIYPQTMMVPQGFDVSVRPTRLMDGRFNLRVQATMTSDLDVKWSSRSDESTPQIQLPSLRVRKCTSSGIVALGEGMVLGIVSQDDEGARFLIVRLVGTSVPMPTFESDQGSTRLYPVGYLLHPYLGMPRLNLGAPSGDDRWRELPQPYDSVFQEESPYFTEEMLYDLLRQSVTPQYWEENLYAMEILSSQLWVAAGKAQHAGLTQVLQQWSQERGKPLALSTFCVLADRATVAAHRAGGDKDWLRALLRDPATQRLHTAAGFAETGSRVEWLDGREYTYVGGIAVEIAQGAERSAPEARGGFRGFYLRLAPSQDSRGFGLDYRMDLHLGMSAGKTLESASMAGVSLSLPASSWQHLEGYVRCVPDRYTLLGEVSVGSDQIALVMTKVQP